MDGDFEPEVWRAFDDHGAQGDIIIVVIGILSRLCV